MKRFTTALMAAFALSLWATSDLWAQDRPTDYRRSLGNLRPENRTAAPAVQGSPPPRTSRTPPVVVQPHVQPYSYGYDYGYPYYDGYYRGYHPHYYYRPYWRRYPRPLYYGPVVVPSETLYGPQAVQRFMGVR